MTAIKKSYGIVLGEVSHTEKKCHSYVESQINDMDELI